MKITSSMTLQALGGAIVLLLASCSQGGARTSTACAPTAPATTQPAASAGAKIPDAELSKSPPELARYIFDHNGCNACHSLDEAAPPRRAKS